MEKKKIEPLYCSVDMKGTGQRLRNLALKAGYTVSDIMEFTGISTQQAIYRWYRGETLPRIETLIVLSKIFGVNINNLLVTNEEIADLRIA